MADLLSFLSKSSIAVREIALELFSWRISCLGLLVVIFASAAWRYGVDEPDESYLFFYWGLCGRR